jgi:hypothetical protein
MSPKGYRERQLAFLFFRSPVVESLSNEQG